MAEPPPKRRRDDDADPQIEPTKRHRNPYINDQQEATQDLLDFLTNLSSDPFLDFPQHPEPDPDDNDNDNNNNNNNNNNNHSTSNTKEEVIDEDDEKERVIRHLLEASDDELGIPSRVDDGGDCGGDGGGGGGDGGGGGGEVAGGGYGDFPVDLCYGLWEIEDEAANYYTLLQSELFMQ